MSRTFAKYEGLGNDFVVLDAPVWPLAEVTPELARALCDRHTGIGGDGLLWLGPAEAEGGDARLVIVNADGSRPEMCGNGVRCVAAYLHHAGRLRLGTSLRLVTDAGLRPAEVVAPDDAHGAVTVAVDMGPARVAPEGVSVAAGSVRVGAIAVDVGNPHAVIFDPVPEPARMDVVAAVTARRDVWPRGVNVEFVTPAAAGAGHGFDVRVHERGVGWTQACGTGAVAVAAAAVARGVHGAVADVPVRIALAGGPLWITVARDTAGGLRALARGPARRVFAGTTDVAARTPA